MSCGPTPFKRVRVKPSTNECETGLVIGTVAWLDLRSDSVTQRFGSAEQPRGLLHLSQDGEQSSQANQAGGNGKPIFEFLRSSQALGKQCLCQLVVVLVLRDI